MRPASTASISWVWAALAALFGLIVWQASTLPLTGAEAGLWYNVVRPRAAADLVAPSAWSGFVYALLAKRCIGLFRLSEFSLRLPSVIAGAVYLASFHRIPRRWWALSLAAPIPIFMHYFSFAGGPGLALGLCATALARPAYAGLWLGCAVAAAPQFWFFPVILAAGFVAVRGFIPGMERIVIPAAAVAFVLLVIPVSHGGPPLPYSAGFTPTDSAFASAARTLRDRAGNQPVDIAASPTARPVLAFYRERYRQRNWAIGGKHPSYYLWLADEPKPVNVARPLVLFQRSGVVLAR